MARPFAPPTLHTGQNGVRHRAVGFTIRSTNRQVCRSQCPPIGLTSCVPASVGNDRWAGLAGPWSECLGWAGFAWHWNSGAHGSNHCSTTLKIVLRPRADSSGMSPCRRPTPTVIDLPQRFGASSRHIIDPGSRLCADHLCATIGFSPKFFGAPAFAKRCCSTRTRRAFPTHLGRATAWTPIGRFFAQAIYGRLRSRNGRRRIPAHRDRIGRHCCLMPPGPPIETGAALSIIVDG